MSDNPAAHSDAPSHDPDGTPGDSLDTLMRLARRGDVVDHATAYGPAYLINHPDHIRHVFHSGNYIRGTFSKMVFGDGLLGSEGAHWQHQRQLMRPAFHPHTVAAFDSIIVAAAEGMLEKWRTAASLGQTVNMAAEMAHVTVNIIAKALFGVEFSERLQTLATSVAELNALSPFIPTLFYTSVLIDGARTRRFRLALERVHAFAQEIIDDRRRNPRPAEDLLAILLRDQEKNGGAGSDDRRIRDEVINMLLAGHVTTADTLTWVWYCLSRHGDIEARLHAELARVLGGRAPSSRDVPELHYTRTIVQETLRLYPPVWIIARKALADDDIGGRRIPANAVVMVSPYLMHRHPEHWRDPEQFDPDRFAPEKSAGRHPYAYFPFGGGPHTCIGNHLAMLEGQLILAAVAQRYKARVAAGAVIEPVAEYTLGAGDSVPMALERRFVS